MARLEETSEPMLEIERAIEAEEAAHDPDVANDDRQTSDEPERAVDEDAQPESHAGDEEREDHEDGEPGEDADEEPAEEDLVESVGGGDALEEVPERMPRARRQYKIQEVIKRRQIMLVQVVKEERGTKGAALTTYLSLAGRYSVLMPNTARGGGISRKITNAQDRKRLKDVAQELEVPEGMGVILRTAGAARTKAEIKRDFEYLIRLWETVRDLTLRSTAPTLVYEEGSLIKRSIRDLYSKDIDEVLAAGEAAYDEAKEFMRMLMPSHAKNVKLYRDAQPIFTRFGVESQLDAMFSPTVQLRSGGYIVLNQTEALVSIDVNSGRATREHHIEDTALKTNLEAAEEIARQLRLRDLAGLIVIDFIDMDEKRNNRSVERRLKDCLKNDRARIQVGRISHFGLLEMSRQRIRSSVLESSTEKCPHCGGTGHLRSVSSVTLQLLRTLEEMLIKSGTHNLVARTRTEVALYALNHKRAHLRELEQRFQIAIMVNADATIAGLQSFVVEKGEQIHTPEAARTLAAQPAGPVPVSDEEEEAEEEVLAAEEASGAAATADAAAAAEAAEAEGEDGAGERADGGRRRRRRRRRRRGEDGEQAPQAVVATDSSDEEEEPDEEFAEGAEPAATVEVDLEVEEDEEEGADAAAEGQAEGDRRRRRRGRRGGRRRRGREGDPPEASTAAEPELSAAVAALDGAVDAAEPAEPVVFAATEPPEPHPDAYESSRHSEHEAAPTDSVPAPVPDTTLEPTTGPAVIAEPEPEPERPRRGSTVREPAPFFMSDQTVQPPPAAEPVQAASIEPVDQAVATPEAHVPEDASAQTQPRRTGWWARRFASKR
jgi:ribonuclease E